MPATDDAPELELRDYLRVLRRRKGVIALSVVVVVTATLVASYLQTPVYQGTAQLLLQSRSSDTLFDPNTGQRNDPTRAVQTEIQVLSSQPVRAEVIRRLGSAPKVAASPVGQTDVIQVKGQSTNPGQAAALANAYASAYIDFRRTQAVNDLMAAAGQLQTKVADFQKQIDAINGQLNTGTLLDRAAAIQSFGAQRDALVSQQGLFKQKLDQLQVDAALRDGGAQLVTPAVVPLSPIKPTPKRSGVLGLAVGLILGVGLAFLFEYLDDSIKNKEDLDRAAHGVPNVGLIPVVPNWKAKDTPRVVGIMEPKSQAAESYRTLRTSVQFMGIGHPVKTIQLTSPNAAEGKTTTIANLGVALARAGQQVCLVCCDLRRPRLHEFFGLSNGVGFTSVLLGELPLAATLQAVEGEERLSVLASGPLPPNPSELLSSPRAGELIDTLEQQFDIVLFDSPPVLPVTDAAVLARRMDSTLIVATAGITTRREVSRAVELLRQVDAPLGGTVLNGVKRESGYGYAGGYNGYYGNTDEAKAGVNPKREHAGRK